MMTEVISQRTMPMRQERFIFSFKRDYVERLDRIAERNAMTRSELIRDVLMHYLGILNEIPDPSEGTEQKEPPEA